MGPLTRLLVIGGLGLSMASCYPVPPRRDPAQLRVRVQPDHASVFINDHYAGRARHLAASPKWLTPGTKYITITAPRHFPHDLRLELPAGETVLDVKLRPVPP